MKKTVTINISGIIFNIDEDAYTKLQKYLEDINAQFSKNDDSKEIIADIEARIAELFSIKITTQNQVINIDDINDMISVMGNPSDFGGDEDTQKKEAETAEVKSDKSWKSKRIYRDPDHRVLGGVCGGLGAYFNLDPVIFRILMVVTFFAFGPLLYIILWIAIPKARTTAQKLEMQGKEVNISNIEKNIKEEFEDVKQNFKKMKEESSFNNNGSFIEKLGHVFILATNSLVKVIVGFLGVILIIVGLALLFAFLSTFIFGFTDFSIGNSAISFSEFVGIFTNNQDIYLLLITLILVASIPIMSIIYGGIKLIFKIKTGNKYIGIIVAAIWFLSLIYVLVFTVEEARKFRNTGTSVVSTTIAGKMDTIVLKKTQKGNINNDDQYIMLGESEFKVIDGKPVMAGRPRIFIEKNDSSNLFVAVKKIARGTTEKEARENAANALFEWNCDTIQGKEIFTFAPVYEIKKGKKWKFTHVEFILKVPVGKVLIIDKNMADLLYCAENTTDLSIDDMAGKTWIMSQNGLSLVK